MSEIIDKNNERVVRFFKSLERMLDGIENLVKNHKPGTLSHRGPPRNASRPIGDARG